MKVLARTQTKRRLLVYTLLGLLLTLCLAVFVLQQWLRTSGSSWLESTIRRELQTSGLDVSIAGLHIDGLTGGLSADSVRLLDNKGEFFRGEDIGVSLSLASLLSGKVAVNVSIHRLLCTRAPLVPESPETSNEGLSVPVIDIPWISKISLKSHAHQVSLASTIIPDSYKGPLSLVLQGNVSDGNLTLDATLESNGSNPYLPQSLNLHGSTDARKQLLTVSSLSLNNPHYTITIQGNYQTTTKESSLEATLDLHDATPYVSIPTGPSRLHLTGSGIAPSGLNASLDFSSRVNETPLNLSITVEEKGNEGQAIDIQSSYGKAQIRGTVSVDSAYTGLNGELLLEDPQASLSALLIPELSESGSLELKLKPSFEKNEQLLGISLQAKDLHYGSYQLKELALSSKAWNLFHEPTYTALIHARAVDVAGNTIPKVSVSIEGDSHALEASLQMDAPKPYPMTAQGKIRIGFSPLSVAIPDLIIQSDNGSLSIAARYENDLYNASITPHRFDVGFLDSLRSNPPLLIQSGSIQVDGSLDDESLPELAIDALSIHHGKGSALLDGTISKDSMKLHAKVQDLILDTLPGVHGQISGSLDALLLTVEGTLQEPLISMETEASNLYTLALKLSSSSRYSKGTLSSRTRIEGDGIRTANASVQAPMTLSFYPWQFQLPQTAPLNGSLQASLDLDELTKPIRARGQTLTGTTELNASLNGTYEEPLYQGKLSVNNASLSSDVIDLVRINLDGSALKDSATLSLQAQDPGGGTLSINATTNLSDPMDSLRADILLDTLSLKLLEYGTALLTADLHYRFHEERRFIDGTINPEEINIQIPSKFSSSTPRLHIVSMEKKEASFLDTLFLDVLFSATQKIFVRGFGANLELKGDLKIEGTASNPQINGGLSLIRGQLQELGKRFKLDRALVNFHGTNPPAPTVDILAQTDTKDATAQIEVLGPIEDPTLTLSSIPELPQDEIISRILFDKVLSDISPLQAIQIAQTLDRLSGAGNSDFIDPLGTIRDTFGIDDFRVESNTDKDVTVGAGKYLTDSVYLELEKGSSAQSTAAKVEVELSSEFSVESKTNETGNTGATLFWEWSY